MDRDEVEEALCAFGMHLHDRRAEILEAWSRSAEGDPKLTTATTLSRAQFYDHMPAMLDALEARLCARTIRDRLSATQDEAINAEGHGLQRWQQGYNEREVMREWIWLHQCLADEHERYVADRTGVAPEAVAAAASLVSGFLVNGMSESVGQYARLHRADASARLGALEDAHCALELLERQRAEAWHQAAHDLRGNLSIVNNVTSILQLTGSGVPPPAKSIQMLERSVASLRALLDDLTTQARLDAGREQRQIAQFDAAQALEELSTSSQPLASGRGLYLKTEGPSRLLVEGDRVKVCRIAQNLLLNALQYTALGGIKITWEETGAGGERWMLCVQDTGPGLATGTVAPLSHALDAATRDTQKLEQEATDAGVGGDEPHQAATLLSRSPPGQIQHGEGIGLAIIKRLCELLDATLELQTKTGEGTTFRVTFPTTYPKG